MARGSEAGECRKQMQCDAFQRWPSWHSHLTSTSYRATWRTKMAFHVSGDSVISNSPQEVFIFCQMAADIGGSTRACIFSGCDSTPKKAEIGSWWWW